MVVQIDHADQAVALELDEWSQSVPDGKYENKCYINFESTKDKVFNFDLPIRIVLHVHHIDVYKLTIAGHVENYLYIESSKV